MCDNKPKVFIVLSERFWDYKSFLIHPLVKFLLFLPLGLSELISINSAEEEILVLTVAKSEETRLVCHLHVSDFIVHHTSWDWKFLGCLLCYLPIIQTFGHSILISVAYVVLAHQIYQISLQVFLSLDQFFMRAHILCSDAHCVEKQHRDE